MADFPKKSIYRILSAVQSPSTSYVFVAEPDGTVSYYESQFSDELKEGQPRLPPYKKKDLLFREFGKTEFDTPVKISSDPASCSLTAVAYKYDNNAELRLYYVDATTKCIREVCSTNGGEWTEGSASNASADASNLAPMTASVDPNGKGKLKVYYYKTGGGEDVKKMFVLFAVVGTEAWSPKPVFGPR